MDATMTRAANADAREAVANAISHEFAYDVGFGFVSQMADRLIAALATEGYTVVPADWAQEASANDNA
jgi:hypothetical protein